MNFLFDHVDIDIDLNEEQKKAVKRYLYRLDINDKIIMMSSSPNFRLDGNGNVITLPKSSLFNVDLPCKLIPESRLIAAETPIYFLDGRSHGYAVYPKETRISNVIDSLTPTSVSINWLPKSAYDDFDMCLRLMDNKPLFDDEDYAERIKEYYINEWNKLKATNASIRDNK